MNSFDRAAVLVTVVTTSMLAAGVAIICWSGEDKTGRMLTWPAAIWFVLLILMLVNDVVRDNKSTPDE